MRCQRCQAPIKRGSLAAKTRHGNILHATCYNAVRAASHQQMNYRPPPPTRPPRLVRSPPLHRPYRHSPAYTPEPVQYRSEPEPEHEPVQYRSDPESLSAGSVVSVISEEASVEEAPLEGGGCTPFNLNLEGGGHAAQTCGGEEEEEFEIDVFMK